MLDTLKGGLIQGFSITFCDIPTDLLPDWTSLWEPWTALRAILNQLEPGCSQMNGSPLLRIAFLWMIPSFARTGGQSTHSTGELPTNELKK